MNRESNNPGKTLINIKMLSTNEIISMIYRKLRIVKYQLLSNSKSVYGSPVLYQPVLIKGQGKVIFEEHVSIGVLNSPYFYSSYAYIEARYPNSSVLIKKETWINNNVCIISEGEGIILESGCLVGSNVCIFDSDFHSLNPQKRTQGIKTAKVIIEENVFIGSNVTILKGVHIGKNSVIANSSLVVNSIPSNVIAGGNPCRVIKTLEHPESIENDF